MKKDFSNKWVGSKQTRKQRKYRYNAPLHIRHKMMSSTLTKELRKKYGKRNFPIVKGDEIKIMVGEFFGKKGKIENVNLNKLKVGIAGIYRTKKDGSKVSVLFDPSNLMILDLNLNDKKRKEALERKLIIKKEKAVKEKVNEKKTEKLKTQIKKSKSDKK